MKKNSLLVAIWFLAACGIFAQNAGVIQELTGNVALKPAGSSVFVAADAGDEVAQNTIVSTGFRSTAVIAVGNSLITVLPLTHLSLAEIQENLNVNLQTGRVRIDAKPQGGTMAACTVQSSGATASARGRNFEFDTLNIKVNEGTAVFRGVSGPAAIAQRGKENSIGADGRPSECAVYSLMPSAPGGGRGSGGGGQQSAAGGSGGGSCCD